MTRAQWISHGAQCACAWSTLALYIRSWQMDALTIIYTFLVCIFLAYLLKRSFERRRPQPQPHHRDPRTTVILQPPQAQDSIDAGPGHLQPDAQPARTEDNEALR